MLTSNLCNCICEKCDKLSTGHWVWCINEWWKPMRRALMMQRGLRYLTVSSAWFLLIRISWFLGNATTTGGRCVIPNIEESGVKLLCKNMSIVLQFRKVEQWNLYGQPTSFSAKDRFVGLLLRHLWSGRNIFLRLNSKICMYVPYMNERTTENKTGKDAVS